MKICDDTRKVLRFLFRQKELQYALLHVSICICISSKCLVEQRRSFNLCVSRARFETLLFLLEAMWMKDYIHALLDESAAFI